MILEGGYFQMKWKIIYLCKCYGWIVSPRPVPPIHIEAQPQCLRMRAFKMMGKFK